MALIKSVRGFTPQIGENTFLADNATVIGDVIIGNNCSIWFNAVLRGDVNSIRIGNRVNIQDGSVIHTLYEKSVTEIGDDVSIGHNVVIHGAKIEDGALIGMGAIILDHAVIGEGSIIAAGAVVLSNTIVEPGSIYRRPCQICQESGLEQSKEMNQKIARNYLMYSEWYKEKMGNCFYSLHLSFMGGATPFGFYHFKKLIVGPNFVGVLMENDRPSMLPQPSPNLPEYHER